MARWIWKMIDASQWFLPEKSFIEKNSSMPQINPEEHAEADPPMIKNIVRILADCRVFIYFPGFQNNQEFQVALFQHLHYLNQ